MILYPTETIYALGVPALDPIELNKLFTLKGRSGTKAVSWLVRSVDDIKLYANVDVVSEKIAATFLPGPLTLVLQANDTVPRSCVAPDGTVGFRMSSDPVAQSVIADFMERYDTPLTCTSANISGQPTLAAPVDILAQFGDRSGMIDTVYEDGPRNGLVSTVLRIIEGEISILREGAIARVALEQIVTSMK